MKHGIVGFLRRAKWAIKRGIHHVSRPVVVSFSFEVYCVESNKLGRWARDEKKRGRKK
jgi:hypothetical protein